VTENTPSTETFDHEALAEDAHEFVAAIEAIHPDPYIGYDSRVDLHAQLERTVRDLPEITTAEEFYRRVAPLVAGMEDTHSLLHSPDYEDTSDGGEEDRQLPVSFRIVGEAVEKTLPNTGLTVRIAGSMFHWVPDPDTNVLQPDQELTPALFERYDRTADAGLRLAFDHAGITEPSGDPPEPIE
jgi:hypothetical protein